jgi:anti-anti-sigma factor
MVVTGSSVVTLLPRARVSQGGRDAEPTVVWLRGEHDGSTVEELADAMARAIALDDADLVLDLSDVDLMDAATVGVIIRAHEFLRRRSRSLELRSPSPCARRVLDSWSDAGLLPPGAVAPTQMRRASGAPTTRLASRLGP